MRCCKCNSDTKVIDSRESNIDNIVRRRRVCVSCGRRFTTHEIATVFFDNEDVITQEMKMRTRKQYIKALNKSAIIKKCVICGETGSKIEGHHEDYNKPLEIIWLCQKHHNIWHTIKKMQSIITEL